MGIINANRADINKKPKDKVIIFTSQDDANNWLDDNIDKEIMKVDFNATERYDIIGVWYRVD